MKNLRNMAVFAQVVDAGTLSGAARRLGVAKSAVSRSVAELERELGVALLHRTTRRITPTEAGARFYEGCARMLATAQAAEGEVRSMQAGPTGLLRVTAAVSIGVEHVVPEVARFTGLYPRLRVEINLEDRYSDLVGEGIDLAVRAGRMADSSLVARTLAPVSSVVVAAPSYLRRRGIPASPAELRRHDWIRYTPYSSRLRFRRGGRIQTVTPAARLATNSGDATMAMLRGGHGLSLTPLWFVKTDLEAGRLQVVLPEYEIRRTAIHAVYPEGKHVLPKVRLLVEALAERFGGMDWVNVAPHWVAGA